MKKKGLLFLLVLSFCLLGLGLTNVRAADIQTAPIRNEGGEYLGRAFNPDFDKMFDDFNRQTLSDFTGTGLWWAFNTTGEPAVETDAYLTDRDSYLHVNYTSALGNTRENPLYKAGVNANEFGTYSYLVFVMKGTNGASINELVLSFRYSDAFNDLDVPFEELLDPDMDPVVEFSGEYQVYIINLKDSLDGRQYTKEGETPVDAGSSMLGFHFMSEAAQEGTVDIKAVYYSNDMNTLGYEENAQNFLIDNFQRENVLDKSGNNWWNGSCGTIVGKHLVIDYTDANAHYRAAGYDCSNAAGTYENFVLRVRGEVGGEDLRISPYYDEGQVWGEPVALSAMKGPDDLAVPAIGTTFTNIVVNFEKVGWQKNINGFKIESPETGTGLVYIDEIFFTNLEYNAEEVDTKYPELDKDILVFDDFNRETLGATSIYDGANPVAINNGFAFIISYHGIERLSVADGSLVFDCTTSDDYIQYTAVSTTRINDGTYPYVVFKLKTTDGGDADNFRIQTIEANDVASGTTWNNGGLKSGNGLEAANENQAGYEYVTEDGFMYVIVDLAASNLGTKPEGFHLFYSGTGKLVIDTIFYAKDKQASFDEETRFVYDDFNRTEFGTSANHYWVNGEHASIVDNALEISFTGSEHAYYGSASANNTMNLKQRYLVLTMKGAEGTDFGSFRIETVVGGTNQGPYFFNNGSIKLADGSTLAVDALTTEYKTFVIDMVASGMNPAMEGIYLICGDWGAGTVYVDEIAFVGEESQFVEEEAFVYDDFNRTEYGTSANHYWVNGERASIVDNALEISFTGSEHAYYGSASANNTMNLKQRYLVLTMKGAEGTDFGSFRIETVIGSTHSSTYYFNNGSIKLADGSTLAVDALTTEYKTFVIDMVASGMNPAMEGIFLICGDWGAGTVYVDEISFIGANTALRKIEQRLVELTPVKLAAPQNVQVVLENGKWVVKFDAVENATGYKLHIYANGSEVATQDVVSGAELTLTALGTYTAKVEALGNGGLLLNSDLSAEASFEIEAEPVKLATPTGLTVELKDGKFVVKFTGVANAASYKVHVYKDGAEVHSQTVTNGQELTYTTAGTYTAKLEAIGNGEEYLNSDFTAAVNFTIEAPETEEPSSCALGCKSSAGMFFMVFSLAACVFVFKRRH